jgi:hypothetical protein
MMESAGEKYTSYKQWKKKREYYLCLGSSQMAF